MTKSKKLDFRPNEFVVYPAHGVGQIVSIEEQEVAGISLELFVISFEKDKMTLRVPTHKATEIGMRALALSRLGGQTGDILGATQQVIEVAVLCLLIASFS